MRVGIGLPNTHAGVTGERLLGWARRADQGPFTSLGVLDRPPYDGYEPFVGLASAAALRAENLSNRHQELKRLPRMAGEPFS